MSTANPVWMLYRLASSRGVEAPKFQEVVQTGLSQYRTFSFSCSFLGGKYNSVGYGKSKKGAKIAAAKSLLSKIDMNTIPPKKTSRKFRKQSSVIGNFLEKEIKLEDYEMESWYIKSEKREKWNISSEIEYTDLDSWYTAEVLDGCNPGANYLPNEVDQTVFGDENGGHYLGQNHYCVRQVEDDMEYYGNELYSAEDRYIIDKHTEIYPTEEELDSIMALVHGVEEALHNIAFNSFQVNITKILGVARVGDLAKGLLLAGDREVKIVVVCAEMPTKSILYSVSNSLSKELLENVTGSFNSESKINVHVFHDEGALCVTKSEVNSCYVPIQVFITLTSTSLRKLDTPYQQSYSDPNLLPISKGIEALTELRRAKWFSVMAMNLPSCVECIRIMKDVLQTDAIWSDLGAWAMELLVEKSLSTAQTDLSPYQAIRRVLEVVSSGVLMPDGIGIVDPCEYGNKDVFSHLTRQMRENITKKAQEDLRRFLFKKPNSVIINYSSGGSSGYVEDLEYW